MTSNLVTQSLGGTYQLGGIHPHLLREPLENGARYLICSDGLSDLLDRTTLEQLLDDDDATSAGTLFEAAMARGGDDNVSLILVRLSRD